MPSTEPVPAAAATSTGRETSRRTCTASSSQRTAPRRVRGSGAPCRIRGRTCGWTCGRIKTDVSPLRPSGASGNHGRRGPPPRPFPGPAGSRGRSQPAPGRSGPRPHAAVSGCEEQPRTASHRLVPRKGTTVFTVLRRSALSIAAAGALVATPALAMGAGVSPATYDASVDPGATVHVTKTVTTPEIPPKPDIVLVVDRTGSMGGAIGDVKAKMGAVIDSVQAAQPDAEFAVVAYCDSGETPFSLVRQLTGSKTDAVNAV